MKKAITIILSILVLCILAVSSIPFLLKDELYEATKNEIQKSVKTDIDFDFSISIWSSFPQLTLSLKNISIKGQDQFTDASLFSAHELSIELNTLSFLQKEEIEIQINISSPIIHAIIAKDGTSNYDIIVLSDEEQKKGKEIAIEEKNENSFTDKYTIKINRFSITDAAILYEDKEGDQILKMTHANIDIKGKIENGTSIIQTELTTNQLSFIMDNIPYLSHTTVTAHTNLKLDDTSNKYYLEENSIHINALELNYDGWVSLNDNGINTDLKGHLKKTDLKAILSLLPAIYANDFENIKTEGKLAFKTSIKGTYNSEENSYPAFEIALDIENGKFSYPDLPKSVDNIQAHLNISNETSNLDNTIVELKGFSADFGKNPISLNFLYKQPLTNPYIAARANGIINFNTIKDFIPLDSIKLSGKLTLNLNLAAFINDIEKSNYNKINANGELELSNFNYKSTDLPLPVHISKMHLTASTNKISLNECNIKTGSSQFNLKGQLSNFLSYALADGTLKGSLKMNAPLINLNELNPPAIQTDSTTTATISAENKIKQTTQNYFSLPEKIEFNIQTKIDRLIYDNYNIEQVNGKLVLENQALQLKPLTMYTLGGKLSLDGTLQSYPKQAAKCTLNLSIKNFDIIETVDKNFTVQELAPFLKHCSGTFSTKMKLNTKIDAELSPLLNTINAKAKINAKNLTIEGSEIQEFAVKKLKKDDFKQLKLKNLAVNIKVINGKLIIEPFRIQTKGYEAIIQGENGLDKSLDYTVALSIPTKDMGKDVNGWINELDKLIKKNNIPIDVQKNIEMSLLITGDIKNPTTTLAIGNKSDLKFTQSKTSTSSSTTSTTSSATKEIAPKVQKEINKQIEILENGTKKEKEEQINTAKKEASKHLNKWLKRKK